MASSLTCDGCGKPIDHVEVKLYMTTRNGEQDAKHRPRDHSQYERHADIGPCCAERLTRIIRWQKRKRRAAA